MKLVAEAQLLQIEICFDYYRRTTDPEYRVEMVTPKLILKLN